MDFRTGSVNWNVRPVSDTGPRASRPSKRQRASGGNDDGINKLLSAAVVSPRFCRLLLSDPALALTKGYRGETFSLAEDDAGIVCSIKASSLRDFAAELLYQTQDSSAGATNATSIQADHEVQFGTNRNKVRTPLRMERS